MLGLSMRSNMVERLRSLFTSRSPGTKSAPARDGRPPKTDKSYSSDIPLVDPASDRFNRWPFSQRLALTIASRDDDAPLILALYGEWGDGKTTCLNFMEVELLKHSHIVPIRFNPWRFPSETELILGFFTTLAEALGRSLPTQREKLGETIGTYGSIVGAALDRKDLAETIRRVLSTVNLEVLRDRLEAILHEEGKRRRRPH